MKKLKVFSVMSVCLLTLSLVFVSCDGGYSDPPPPPSPSGTSNPGGTNNPSNPSNPSGTSGTGLNGTWYSYGNVQKYYFNNGNYEYSVNGDPNKKGTYTTTNNDSMTMTVTHIGSYYVSSWTWLESSTWYSKDELRTGYLNYHREAYRAQYLSYFQQEYARLIANGKAVFGNVGDAYAYANDVFYIQYGSSNIDSIVDNMVNSSMSSYETTIDSQLSYWFSNSTVAYSLSGNTLILGGMSLTRN